MADPKNINAGTSNPQSKISNCNPAEQSCPGQGGGTGLSEEQNFTAPPETQTQMPGAPNTTPQQNLNGLPRCGRDGK